MWRHNRKHGREKSGEFENHKTVRNLAFLAAGLGIGTGVTLLLAPESGEEVRHAIGRRYHKAMKNLGRQTEELRDRCEDFLEHARDLRGRSSRLFHLGRGGEPMRRAV